MIKGGHPKNRMRINATNDKLLSTFRNLTRRDQIIEVDPNYDQWKNLHRKVSIRAKIHFVFSDSIGRSKFELSRRNDKTSFPYTECFHSVCATSSKCVCGGAGWINNTTVVTMFTETIYHYTYTQIHEQFRNTANAKGCTHVQYVTLMWPNTISECGTVFNAMLNEKQTRKVSDQLEYKSTVINICANDKYPFPSASDTLTLVLNGFIKTSFGYVSLEKVLSDDSYYIFEIIETPTSAIKPSQSITDDFYNQNRIILTCNCESNSVVGGRMEIKWYLTLVTAQMVAAMQSRMTADMSIENIFGRSTGMQFSGHTLGIFMMLYYEKCNTINCVAGRYVKHGKMTGSQGFTNTVVNRITTALLPHRSEAESVYAGMDEYWNTFDKSEKVIKSAAAFAFLTATVISSIVVGTQVPVLSPIAIAIIKSALGDTIKDYLFNPKAYAECLMRQRIKMHVEQFAKILAHPDRYQTQKLRFWRFTERGVYQQKVGYVISPDDKLILPSVILQHNEYACVNCDNSDSSIMTQMHKCGNRYCAICLATHLCSRNIPIPKLTQMKTRRMVAGPCDIVIATYSHAVDKTMPLIGSGNFRLTSGVAYFMGGYNANPKLYQQTKTATYIYKVIVAYGRGTYAGGRPWRSLKQSSNMHATINYFCPAHTAGVKSIPMRQPYCLICKAMNGVAMAVQASHVITNYAMGLMNVPFIGGTTQIALQATKTVVSLVPNLTVGLIPSKIVTHLKHGIFITQTLNSAGYNATQNLLTAFNRTFSKTLTSLKRIHNPKIISQRTRMMRIPISNLVKSLNRVCQRGVTSTTLFGRKVCTITAQSQAEALDIIEKLKNVLDRSNTRAREFQINDDASSDEETETEWELRTLLKAEFADKPDEFIEGASISGDESTSTVSNESNAFESEVEENDETNATTEELPDEIEVISPHDERETVEIGDNVLIQHQGSSYVARVVDGYHHTDLFKIGPSIFFGNRTPSDFNWCEYMNRQDDSVFNQRGYTYKGTPFERKPFSFDAFPAFSETICFDTKCEVVKETSFYIKIKSQQRHEPELLGNNIPVKNIFLDTNYYKIADYLEGKENNYLDELRLRFDKANKNTEKAIRHKDEIFSIVDRKPREKKGKKGGSTSDESQTEAMEKVLDISGLQKIKEKYSSQPKGKVSKNKSAITNRDKARFAQLVNTGKPVEHDEEEESEKEEEENEEEEEMCEINEDEEPSEDDCMPFVPKSAGSQNPVSYDEQADKFIERVKIQLETTRKARELAYKSFEEEIKERDFENFLQEEVQMEHEMHDTRDVEQLLINFQEEWLREEKKKIDNKIIDYKIKGRKFLYGTEFGTWEQFCISHKLPLRGESCVAYCKMFKRKPIKDVLIGFASYDIYHHEDDATRFLLAKKSDVVYHEEPEQQSYQNFCKKIESAEDYQELKRIEIENEKEKALLEKYLSQNIGPQLNEMREINERISNQNIRYKQMLEEIDTLANNGVQEHQLTVDDLRKLEQRAQTRNDIREEVNSLLLHCNELLERDTQMIRAKEQVVTTTRDLKSLVEWSQQNAPWVSYVLNHTAQITDIKQWMSENQAAYIQTLKLQKRNQKLANLAQSLKNSEIREQAKLLELNNQILIQKQKDEEAAKQRQMRQEQRLKQQQEQQAYEEAQRLLKLQKDEEERVQKEEEEKRQKEEQEKKMLEEQEAQRQKEEQDKKEEEERIRIEELMKMQTMKNVFINALKESTTVINPPAYIAIAQNNDVLHLSKQEIPVLRGIDKIDEPHFIKSDEETMKRIFFSPFNFLLCPTVYTRMMKIDNLFPTNRTQWAILALWRGHNLPVEESIDEQEIIDYFTSPYDNVPINDLFVHVNTDQNAAISLLKEAKSCQSKIGKDGIVAGPLFSMFDTYCNANTMENWRRLHFQLREYILNSLVNSAPKVAKNNKLLFLSMHEKIVMSYVKLFVNQEIKIVWIDGVGAVGKTKAWDIWSRTRNTYMAHLTKSSKIKKNGKSKTFQNALFGLACGAFFCDEMGKAQIELLAAYAMLFTENGDIMYGFSDSSQGIGLGNHKGFYTEFNSQQIRNTRLHLFKREEGEIMYANRQHGPVSDLIYFLCYGRNECLFKIKYPKVTVKCREREDRPALKLLYYDEPTDDRDEFDQPLVTNSPFCYIDENIDLLTVHKQEDAQQFSCMIASQQTHDGPFKFWASNTNNDYVWNYYNVLTIAQSQGHTEHGKYATFMTPHENMWDSWATVVSLTRPTHTLFVNESLFKTIESFGKMLMGTIVPCIETESIGCFLNSKLGNKEQKAVCRGIQQNTTSDMWVCYKEQTKEEKYSHIVSYIKSIFKKGKVHDLTPGSFQFSRMVDSYTYERSEFDANQTTGEWQINLKPGPDKEFGDNDVYFIDAPTNRIARSAKGEEYIDQDALLNWIAQQSRHIIYKVTNPYGIGTEIITNFNVYNKFHNKDGTWQKMEWYFHYDPNEEPIRRPGSYKNPQGKTHRCIEFPSLPMDEINDKSLYEIWSIDDGVKQHEQLTVIESIGELVTPLSFYPNRRTNHLFATLHFHKHDPNPSRIDKKNRFCNILYANACHMICEDYPNNREAKCECGRKLTLTKSKNTQLNVVNLHDSSEIIGTLWPKTQKIHFSDHEVEEGLVPLITTKKELKMLKGIKLRNKRNIIPQASYSHIAPIDELKNCVPVNYRNSQKNRMISFVERLYKSPNVNLYLASILAYLVPHVFAWCYKNKKLPDMKPVSEWRDLNERYAAFLKKKPAHRKRAYEARKDYFDEGKARTFSTFVKNEKLVNLYNDEQEYKVPRNICAMHIDSQYAGMISDACMEEMRNGRTFANDEITITSNMTGEDLAEDMFIRKAKWDTDFGKYDRSIHYLIKIAVIVCTFILWCFGSGVSLIDMFNMGSYFSSASWSYNLNEFICKMKWIVINTWWAIAKTDFFTATLFGKTFSGDWSTLLLNCMMTIFFISLVAYLHDYTSWFARILGDDSNNDQPEEFMIHTQQILTGIGMELEIIPRSVDVQTYNSQIALRDKNGYAFLSPLDKKAVAKQFFVPIPASQRNYTELTKFQKDVVQNQNYVFNFSGDPVVKALQKISVEKHGIVKKFDREKYRYIKNDNPFKANNIHYHDISDFSFEMLANHVYDMSAVSLKRELAANNFNKIFEDYSQFNFLSDKSGSAFDAHHDFCEMVVHF